MDEVVKAQSAHESFDADEHERSLDHTKYEWRMLEHLVSVSRSG